MTRSGSSFVGFAARWQSRVAGAMLGSIVVCSVATGATDSAGTQQTGKHSAAAERAVSCEQSWSDLSELHNKQQSSDDAMLVPWLAQKSRCEGTGIYEYRLAALYNSLGRAESAQAVIDSALKLRNNPYRHYVQTLQLSMRFQSNLKKRVSEPEPYRKIITETDSLVRAHPDWILGFQLLSDVHLHIGSYDGAIVNAKKVLEVDDSMWTAHRVLVLAYAAKNQYESARPHVERAVRLNDGLLSALDFMSAAALTYTALGDFESAQNVIKTLNVRNATLRGDPRFRQVIATLLRHVEDAKTKAQAAK